MYTFMSRRSRSSCGTNHRAERPVNASPCDGEHVAASERNGGERAQWRRASTGADSALAARKATQQHGNWNDNGSDRWADNAPLRARDSHRRSRQGSDHRPSSMNTHPHLHMADRDASTKGQPTDAAAVVDLGNQVFERVPWRFFILIEVEP